MRLLVLVSVLFLFACTEKKTDFSIGNIPNPREHASFVSNPDHIINETTTGQLNSLMNGLDKEGTAYVAIVLVKTIGDKVPKDVAHEIFKLWKPGDPAKNNGLVVLLVEDQHRIEFETGYGLEGDLPDVICFRIQQQKMLPLFKENNYDEGMIQGMEAVASVLRHPGENADTEPVTVDGVAVNTEITDTSIAAAAPVKDGLIDLPADTAAGVVMSDSEKFSIVQKAIDEQNYIEQTTPQRKLPGEWTVFLYLFYIVISRIVAGFFIRKKEKPFNNPPILYNPSFFSGLWIYAFPFIAFGAMIWFTNYNVYWWTLVVIFYLNWLSYLIYRVTIININAKRLLSTNRKQRYDALNLAHKGFGAYAYVFPIPFYFYHKWNQHRLTGIRNTPFPCEQCNTPMELIDKKNKKQYLDEGQAVEEKIASVSYDVWHCNTCDKVKVTGYDNIYSSATECPKCHYKTLQAGKKVVIQRASYSSEGVGSQDFNCKHCGHIEKVPYVIAKLSSSSSSSSGSSSSSSSSSSSGSSSGGSSGGGGAGSSW
jgi:uncharacterized protein